MIHLSFVNHLDFVKNKIKINGLWTGRTVPNFLDWEPTKSLEERMVRGEDEVGVTEENQETHRLSSDGPRKRERQGRCTSLEGVSRNTSFKE